MMQNIWLFVSYVCGLFCNMYMSYSFILLFDLFCCLYVEFCISLIGEQNFSRGSMPGVYSVAVVGQVNLAHQPPSVSQGLTKLNYKPYVFSPDFCFYAIKFYLL